MEGETADDPLRRADHEQFVVHGLIDGRLAEEIPDGDEHLPLRRAEVHEGQRLAHLDVEARIEHGAVDSGVGGRRADSRRDAAGATKTRNERSPDGAQCARVSVYSIDPWNRFATVVRTPAAQPLALTSPPLPTK